MVQSKAQECKRTPQLDAQDPLELAKDLRVGDRLPTLVILNDARLLVNLLGYVLLRQLALQPRSTHSLNK